jgi:mRNA interferase RelE/StbE
LNYTIFIKPSAKKELLSLEKEVIRRIDRIILKLKDNPRFPGVIKLKGWNLYRIRVGDYRIVYTIDDENRIVEIIAIGHRRDVYNF